MKRKIILASASPRRRELLAQIGLDFIVKPSRSEPEVPMALSTNPAVLVCELSRIKAEDVARNAGEGIIIAADTLVYYNGEILGKPASAEDARQMLKKLNGVMHEVYTGLTLIDMESRITLTEYEKTQVYFRALSEREIDAYINTGEPMDKAGAYGIQGFGALLVEKINGCYFNVVGLPLVRLNNMLNKLGIYLLGEE